jgi:CopG family nickel-responsive transcriptional regulator
VSVEKELLGKFDRLIARKGYANRCEALRDLMRQALIEKAWDENALTVATVTLVYDHHDPGLEAALTEIQHHHHENVVAAMHSHLDEHDCLQVIILRGKAKAIKHLADELIAAKGVKHGDMVMTGAV